MAKKDTYKSLLLELMECAELNQDSIEPETARLLEKISDSLRISEFDEEEDFEGYDEDEEYVDDLNWDSGDTPEEV
jgi:hypothetical protein